MSTSDRLITCLNCGVADLPDWIGDGDPAVARWECPHCGTLVREEPIAGGMPILTVVQQRFDGTIALSPGATLESLLAGSRAARAAYQQEQRRRAAQAPEA